jgi:hypothetical protein
VAVRVGEVLKQGRYEPNRAYNFPAGDRHRNAKIDIYRHVGACVVAVDPDTKADHEVTVSCSDPSLSAIKLNVNVQSVAAQVQKQRREEKAKNVKNQAEGYLARYSIEERLSAAVKALLKEQPANPTDFLCKFLAAAEGETPYINRTKNGSSKKATIGKAESACTNVVSSSPPAVASQPTAPTAMNAGKFAEYYKAQVLPNVAADCYDALYAKFPAPKNMYKMCYQSLQNGQAQGQTSSAAMAPTASAAAPAAETQTYAEATALSAGKFAENALDANFPGPKTTDTTRNTSLQDINSANSENAPEKKPCIMASNMLVGPQFYSLNLPNRLMLI